MNICRVFPSVTKATPRDELCRYDVPGLFDPPECDEIHVSVTFTWDIDRAEYLHKAWSAVHPVVKIGGPALGDPGGEFVPGRYLKPGHVITSRGCPNRCAYCMAQKREGGIRELEVKQGWNILDNNILATSDAHFASVIAMLKEQKGRIVFTGGLEARRLTADRAQMLRKAKTDHVYFANDRPGDLEHIRSAVEIMRNAGFPKSAIYAYVLIGYKNDTMPEAEKRLMDTYNAGAFPFAMLYRDASGNKRGIQWRRFQRSWARPAATKTVLKEHYIKEIISILKGPNP